MAWPQALCHFWGCSCELSSAWQRGWLLLDNGPTRVLKDRRLNAAPVTAVVCSEASGTGPGFQPAGGAAGVCTGAHPAADSDPRHRE